MATLQDPAGQTVSIHPTMRATSRRASPTRTGRSTPTSTARTSSRGYLLQGILDENNSRFATYFYNSSGLAVGSQHAGNLAPGSTTRVGRAASRCAMRAAPSAATPIQVSTASTSTPASPSLRLRGSVRPRRPSPTAPTTTFPCAATSTATAPTTRATDLTRNLETSRTEGLTSAGAATPATRTIETQWHATYRLPTLITEKNAAGSVLRTTAMGYDHERQPPHAHDCRRAREPEPHLDLHYNANGSRTDGWMVRGTDVSDVTAYSYYANSATCPGSARGGLPRPGRDDHQRRRARDEHHRVRRPRAAAFHHRSQLAVVTSLATTRASA